MIFGPSDLYSLHRLSHSDINLNPPTNCAVIKHEISIRKRINAFAERTSCHGVNRIADDKSTPNNWYRWKNLVWLGLTLSSFIMAGVSIYQIIQDYTSHPTSTMLKSEHLTKLEFPAVTFCNLNIAILDRILVHKRFDFLREFVKGDFKTINRQRVQRQTNMHFSILSVAEKKAAGHALEEMLLDCLFEGDPCHVDDFFTTIDYRFGVCFSINYRFNCSNGRNENARVVNKTGKNEGLTLILDVQSDLYLPVTDEVGVQMSVHEPCKYPAMKEHGIAIAPGFMTGLGLSQEETFDAKPPYGRCVIDKSEKVISRNMYGYDGLSYNKRACKRSCTQAHIIQTCGCCDSSLPCNPDNLPAIFGVTLPNASDIPSCRHNDSACVMPFKDNILGGAGCETECPPECIKVSYKIHQSTTMWPNKMLASDIFKRINGSSRLGGNASAEQQLSFIRENVLKLDVHFVSRTKTVIITQPTYTWNVLLSNLGGQLGLWLGFSLLTAFEFLELLLDVVVIQGINTAWQLIKFKFKVGKIKPVV